MNAGRPAFTTLSSIGATYFSRTRMSSTCRPFKVILSAAKNVRYDHTPYFKVYAAADEPLAAVEPILEGDLVAYRDRTSSIWRLGAVVDIPKAEQYHVRSLCSHHPAESGTLECFVNWAVDNSEPMLIRPDTYEITIVDADYEERIVQDRLENPHGEVSEDCWRISARLLDTLGVSIPRI